MQQVVVYEASVGSGNGLTGAVVDSVRAASDEGQWVHNEDVKDVACEHVIADEMWSVVKKSKNGRC